MTDFICAYFGDDWTITARGFSSLKQAEKHGLYMMPTVVFSDLLLSLKVMTGGRYEKISVFCLLPITPLRW